jgi:hypothetical protein
MRALFISFLLSASFAQAQESAASDPSFDAAFVIARCGESADPEVVGLEALEQECPGLTRALEESGLAPHLPELERDTLNSYGLMDLRALEERYRQTSASDVQLSVDTLEPILDEFRKQQQAQAPLSWFERLKRWLRNLIKQPPQDDDSWLTRWLRDLDVPQAVTRWTLYVSIALILAMAAAVIINELRAAGVWKRSARRREQGNLSTASPQRLHPHDLDSLSLHERPAALLERLVLALVEAGRLRTQKSLTHRELGARARFDAEEQRKRFESVALLGERLVYDNVVIADQEIDRVLEDGRTLEHELARARTVS